MKAWNNGKLLFQAYFFCLKTEDFPRHRVPWCIRAGQGMMGSQIGKSLFEKKHTFVRKPEYSSEQINLLTIEHMFDILYLSLP